MIQKDFFNDKYKNEKRAVAIYIQDKIEGKSSKHTKRTLFIHQGHAQLKT